MIEATGNLWTYRKPDWSIDQPDARVITTNGFKKRDGSCVMGRGCAREARDRWPWLAKSVGQDLIAHGNHCRKYAVEQAWWLVTMPVKPEYGPNGEPGWKARAQPELIKRSAQELVKMANDYSWKSIIVPRPGCGNGGLDWDVVGPELADILDDRFTVITFA